MPAADPAPRSRAPEGANPAWLTVDIVFENEEWPEPESMQALVREAAAALAKVLAGADGEAAEACIALSSDAHVRSLNAGFRGKDMPTNVLSFPAVPGVGPAAASPRFLGDIVIARETVEREASSQGIPFADHFRHLTVHGLLHLLGYDHESDGQAAEMEGLEIEVLATLGIPDPYAGSEPLQNATRC